MSDKLKCVGHLIAKARTVILIGKPFALLFIGACVVHTAPHPDPPHCLHSFLFVGQRDRHLFKGPFIQRAGTLEALRCLILL